MTCSGCNIWPSVCCFMNHSCVYKCTATQLVSRQLRLPMKPKAHRLCEPYATFPGEAGSKQGSNTAAKPRLRTHTAYIIWKEVARLRAARSCARFPLLSISHATQQSVRTACVGIENTLFLVVERWSRTLGIASGLLGSGEIECMCKKDKHKSGFWKVPDIFYFHSVLSHFVSIQSSSRRSSIIANNLRVISIFEWVHVGESFKTWYCKTVVM